MASMNGKTTALAGLGLFVVVTAAAAAYLAVRSGPPEGFDAKLEQAVASLEQRRWEPPPLSDHTDRETGNAFEALRTVTENHDVRDFGAVFAARGQVVRDLDAGELSQASIDAVTRTRVQTFLDKLRTATRHTWSWTTADVAAHASTTGDLPELENDTSPGIPIEVLFRATRMLAADALRDGGGVCLQRAARLVRFIDYATVGGPLTVLMARAAAVGYLRYLVPRCASRADAEALTEARRKFRLLAEHPPPTGAALEAEVLVIALNMRDRLAEAGPVPLGVGEVYRMWRAPTSYAQLEQLLDARTKLRNVDSEHYPESTGAVDAFLESADGTALANQSTFLRQYLPKDQIAHSAVRAAVLTVAHYERLDDRHRDLEAPDLIDEPVVRDAISGEPMRWRPADKGAYRICYRKMDSGEMCWRLPPAETAPD